MYPYEWIAKKNEVIRTLPMKNESGFLNAFIFFLNDKTAEARAAETRFAIHPYCQSFPFQVSLDKADYATMRADMGRYLVAVKGRASVARKKEIAGKLNGLALYVERRDENGKPVIGRDGHPVKIAIAPPPVFEVVGGKIEAVAVPAISGMEAACWFALSLISKRADSIRRCTLETCGEWFDGQRTKSLAFCCARHSKEHNDEMQRRRQYNRRNPGDPQPIVRATAPKRRKKSRHP